MSNTRMPIFDLLTKPLFDSDQLGRIAYIIVSLAFILWLIVVKRPGAKTPRGGPSLAQSPLRDIGVDEFSKRPFSQRGNPLSSPTKAAFPFKRQLLADDEQEMFQVMVRAAAKLNLLVHPKVSLSSIFDGLLDAEVANSDVPGASAVSFLLTDQRDLKVVAGVQVEPKRQISADAQVVSDKRSTLFRSAKLPLLRLYNLTSYTEDELRARFEDALGVQPLQ